MAWRHGLTGVRADLHAALPDLTAPGCSRRVVGWARACGISVARSASGTPGTAGRAATASISDLSRRLRVAAEHLGPTYIKLGQIIASGDGIFPPELVAEFKWCRDQVPAEPWPVVERVLIEELGAPIHTVFASVDHTPKAAASIAQVHPATLRDGTPVVIKIQRPSVAAHVRQDLAVMAWLAPHLVGRIPVAALANPPALVELFAETIMEELDFRLEAENMLDIAMTFAELDQRSFVVPRPHPDPGDAAHARHGAARRVQLRRRRGDARRRHRHRGGRAGRDDRLPRGLHDVRHLPRRPARREPLRPASGKTALLDFGITGRLTEAKRLALLSLLVGASNADIPTEVSALRDLGAFPDDVDIDAVIEQLGLDRPPIDPTQLTPDELVGEMQRSIKTLLALGAKLPKELMLFVKNLMFLDGAIATLAPDLDLFAEVESIALMFATKHGEQIMAQLGLEQQEDWAPDLSGVKASFGLDESTEHLTHRELQARRAQVREKFEGRRRRRARAAFLRSAVGEGAGGHVAGAFDGSRV